jgi:hypothetical protein
MTERVNVVISSTSKDLADHRAQAKAAIEQWGGHALVMENLPSSPEDAITESLKLVDEAEIYVGLFAHRYGYVPDSPRNPDRISITEMEYRRAVERGIPVLIFVMHEEHSLTAAMVEKGEGVEKLQRLKDELGKQYVVNFFKSADDLRACVLLSLNKLPPSHPESGWQPSPPGDPDVLPDRGELPPRIAAAGHEAQPALRRAREGHARSRPAAAARRWAAVITPAAAATGRAGSQDQLAWNSPTPTGAASRASTG